MLFFYVENALEYFVIELYELYVNDENLIELYELYMKDENCMKLMSYI